ncbi:uncharacterized protein TrAtP1_002318 [Trichoderma atroviride]|uniref:uncharacterized protein n=1 Tax=Hypocrea atroviridis TaxID=63577 RepID=UPI00332D264B|nr:hypothetical protein TrAtP1_002318 [Trichoderma atroviride]
MDKRASLPRTTHRSNPSLMPPFSVIGGRNDQASPPNPTPDLKIVTRHPQRFSQLMQGSLLLFLLLLATDPGIWLDKAYRVTLYILPNKEHIAENRKLGRMSG